MWLSSQSGWKMLVEGGEEGGQVDVDFGVGDGEAVGGELEEAFAGVDVGDAILGIEQPKIGDAHAGVVFHDAGGARQAVFWREDFDAEDGRGEDNLFLGRIAAEEA